MKDDQQLSRSEIKKRSDELLKHMIGRPPQPHGASPHEAKTEKAKATGGRRKARREKHAPAS